MFRFLSTLVFLFCLSLVATGQEQTPLIGSQATEPATPLIIPLPVVNETVTRILVIGDSMAGGLGAGMARVALGDDTVQVVSRFNESSAITRPDVYDWAAAIPKIMDGKEFNAVVVLIGLNDRQDIRGATGPLKFNTPEWIASYQANTDAIVAALAAQNVKVFWLGEPPMGDAAYDNDMKTVTALQKARVVAKGATFIDTRPAFSNPDGSYLDFGPDDTGEVKKLRQRDGVTFLKQGNSKFGQIVLAAIKAGGVTPPAAVVVTPDPVVAAAPALGPEIPGPVFGQQDANGADVLLDSAAIIAMAANPSSAPSSVDRLFKVGQSSVAPAGRFDDFSYVAPTAN